MTEIYWITRLIELNTVFITIWILSIIAFVLLIIALPIFVDGWDDAIEYKIKRWLRIIILLFSIGTFGDVLIPSSNDMLLIYGLGSVKEYVESNDKAKQLPDKAIDALTRYLDSIEEDKKDKN